MEKKESYVGLTAKIILVVNVVAFLVTKSKGNLSDPNFLFSCGANNWDAIFNHGEYYRLITSMFLHTGWVHLIMNMLFLLALTPLVTKSVGKIGFVVVYFTSGICAGLLSAYINMANNDMVVSVGASGAVFGLMGTIGIIVLYAKNEKYMLFGPLFYAILSYAVGVDIMAHIGGLIGGILIALVYSKSIKSKKDIIVQTIDGL